MPNSGSIKKAAAWQQHFQIHPGSQPHFPHYNMGGRPVYLPTLITRIINAWPTKDGKMPVTALQFFNTTGLTLTSSGKGTLDGNGAKSLAII